MNGKVIYEIKFSDTIMSESRTSGSIETEEKTYTTPPSTKAISVCA